MLQIATRYHGVKDQMISNHSTVCATGYVLTINAINSPYAYSERYKKGSVTVYALNLHDETSEIILTDPHLTSSTKEVYWLTPHGPTGLVSKYVFSLSFR